MPSANYYPNWVKELTVGEKIIVHEYNRGRVETVTKITATTIDATNGNTVTKFTKNCNAVGKYSSAHISQWTASEQERIDSNARKQAHRAVILPFMDSKCSMVRQGYDEQELAILAEAVAKVEAMYKARSDAETARWEAEKKAEQDKILARGLAERWGVNQ